MHAFEVAAVKERLREAGGGYEIVHDSVGLEVGVYSLVAPEPDRQQPHDDDELYNDIRVTRRGDSVPVTASEVPSDVAPRTLPLTDVLFSTVGQAQTLADNLLRRYQAAVYHPTKMVMRPPYDSPLWAATLGVELGSKITILRRPPGGGAAIDVDCLILGVTHDITPEFWEITWDLAPAEVLLEGYWYLGLAGHSELGISTVLG